MSRAFARKGAVLLRIHKIAAASALSVVTAASLIATTGAGASATPRVGSIVIPNSTVKVVPATHLVDGQKVTVNMTKFNDDADGTVLHIAECSTKIFQDQSSEDCSVTAQATTAVVTNHAATAKLVIHTGANFHPNKKGVKCAPGPKFTCDVIVTDNLDPTMIVDSGFAQLTLGKKTTTTLSGKKSVKAGSTLHLAIVTKGGHLPTGKVVVKDGSKVVKTLTEKTSGKLKTVEKHMKKGTHHLTATYSGDSSNLKSHGKLTVKVK